MTDEAALNKTYFLRNSARTLVRPVPHLVMRGSRPNIRPGVPAWRAHVLLDLAWLIASVALVFAVYLLEAEVGDIVLYIAILGLLHSLLGFLAHGGVRISAPGIFLLGTALFGYFPTLYYRVVSGRDGLHAMELTGLSAVLVSQIVMYSIWRRSGDGGALPRQPIPSPRSVTLVGVLSGGGLLVAAATLRWLGVEGQGSLTRAAGYAGVVVAALSLVRGKSRLGFGTLIVLGGLFVFFFTTMFTEGGRLVLGSLAAALGLVVCTRWRPRLLKPVALAILPLGVYVLARMRSGSRSDLSTGYREAGIESVVWPQRRFFDVLQGITDGTLELGWGQTFANSLVAWVPRGIWEGKPVGFGYELTAIYRPELLPFGHSEAALLYGEFVYNFGVFGLLMLTGVCGVSILMLDRLLVAAQGSARESLTSLVAEAALIIVVACLLDLVWVGTWTYIERAGFAVAVLGALYVLFAVVESIAPDAYDSRQAGKTGV